MIQTVLSFVKWWPLFYLINQVGYYRIPKIIKERKAGFDVQKEINLAILEFIMVIILFLYYIRPEWF